MEIGLLLAPLRKWWRLIGLAALIAAVSTLVGSLVQPKIYVSRTTLIIGQSINNPNPSSAQFNLEQELAKIYADMGSREPVRQATMEALGLEWLPGYLVNALPNTQLLEITVSDTDPARAQAVAAELANQLIRITPTGSEGQDAGQQAFTQEQLARLQGDIETTEDEVAVLQAQLGGLRSAGEIADTEREIAALEDKLRTLQNTYARLLTGTPGGAINSLAVVEPAQLPRRPTGSNPVVSIALAALLGASVAGAGAYAIEFLDRRLNLPGEALRALGWPLIGEIGVMPEVVNPAAFVSDQPQSAIANSFRSLKTNLELAGLGTSFKTLLVTGPAVGEGKSTVAHNLALTLAMAQRSVILIEGDAYRPQPAFGDHKGLSDLLLEGGKPTDYLTPSSHPNLSVLSAGIKPLDALGILDTRNLVKILAAFKEVADVIVIDGPPSFVADALVLAASADGVLVVVRLGQSPLDAATKMRAQFRAASVNVEGVVLNGVPRKPAYQSAYYEQQAAALKQSAWQAAMARIWGGLEGLKSSPGPARNGSDPARKATLWAGAVERIKGIRGGRWTPPLDDDEFHETPV